MQLLVHTGTDPAAFCVAPGHHGAIRPKRCKGPRGGANLLHISQPLLGSPIAPNKGGHPWFFLLFGFGTPKRKRGQSVLLGNPASWIRVVCPPNRESPHVTTEPQAHPKARNPKCAHKRSPLNPKP